MKKIIKLTESDLTKIVKRVINESYDTKIDTTNFQSEFPKLKELKPYGLTYSVKALKNLLVSSKKPDGSYGNNKWTRESMPFPPELDILNVIFQSRIAKFYFNSRAKDKGKYPTNWATLISKEDLDNFPIPPSVFNSVIDILTKDKS